MAHDPGRGHLSDDSTLRAVQPGTETFRTSRGTEGTQPPPQQCFLNTSNCYKLCTYKLSVGSDISRADEGQEESGLTKPSSL